MSRISVFESTDQGPRFMDLESRLFESRIIYLDEMITSLVSTRIVQQIQYLNSTAEHFEGEDKDIRIQISSPGGCVISGLAIYDAIKTSKCDVRTYALGQASSMAALILASGSKGKRYSYENASILLHQPLTNHGPGGQVTDIEIHSKQLVKIKNNKIKILSKEIGKSQKLIREDLERDKYFTASEAKKYGIIDKIIRKKR